MNIYRMIVDKMTVCKMTIDKTSVEKINVYMISPGGTRMIEILTVNATK